MVARDPRIAQHKIIVWATTDRPASATDKG